MREVGSHTHQTDRRLKSAVRYVSGYRLPVSSELLELIKQKFKAGTYASNIDCFLGDLRTDLGLFTYCIEGLVRRLRRDGECIEAPFSASTLIREAGINRLQEILHVEADAISPHTIGGGTNLQMLRFQETVISASAAQILAESFAVEPEQAYASALMRQFGIALIAWNYPGVYEDAVSQLQEGDTLDTALAVRLGFSPALLASRVLHSWGLGVAAVRSLGIPIDELDPESEVIDTVGDTLTQICEVGEALARAANPSIYPDARDDWHYARSEIEGRLGPNGMESITACYLENCETYITYAPSIFEPGGPLEPDFLETSFADDSGSINPYMACCEPGLQREMRSFYRAVVDIPTAPERVRCLVHQIIPATDFYAGCIYTVDPTVMMLVPQLEIGTDALRTFSPVDYSLVTSKADIVAVAFQAMLPVVGYKQGAEGEACTALAGAFGGRQRSGVLYLEVPHVIAAEAQDRYMFHFKALVCALNDALGL